jgi:hypothetical protein
MMEIIGMGIAVVFAGYLIYPRPPQRFSGSDLPRYRRLQEATRRNEIHPFEQ